jgi:hypothetical protein
LISGFETITMLDKFLPWSMSDRKTQAPLFLVKLYLRLPALWKVFGKQFLLLCRKNSRHDR